MDQIFADKVAIVTGGNNGIGLTTVTGLLESGAKVACLDLGDSATQAAENLHYVKCDISSEEAVKAAIASVIEKFGRIDILINNAGITDNLESVGDVTSATWHRVFSVNVTGPFNLMQSCIPHILKNDPKPAPDAPPSISRFGEQQPPRAPSKGVIINVCSVAAIHGASAGAAYTASKHALLGLSRNTAWMYRDQGLRVNAVLPGGVVTNLAKNSGANISQQGFQTLMPFLSCQNPALIIPGAVADAILFLASVRADTISGAELTVDNGWNAA